MPDASVDLGIILARPEVIDGDTPYATQKQDHKLDKAIDFEILKEFLNQLILKRKSQLKKIYIIIIGRLAQL